tara:strand:- start:3186 stop:4514 length:1329 start_codon:yes stop_codon:yes gene_type:complete
MWNKIKSDLSLQIILSVVLAATIFAPIGSSSLADNEIILWINQNIFSLGGDLFMNALKMLILPLVVCGLLTGIVSMSDVSKMKSLAIGTVGLYLMTTVIALVGALTLASLYSSLIGFGSVDTSGVEAAVTTSSEGLAAMVANIIPSNIVIAMYDGNMLAVIFVVVLFSIATVTVSPAIRETVASGADNANEIVLKATGIIMSFAPYGIFCLMAKTFIANGVDTMLPLLGYVIVLVSMLLLHIVVTYGAVVKFVAGVSPKMFFSKMKEIWVFAFSTGSSSATIPVTMKVVEKRMGVSSSSASFTIPLGATINMDGTACMQGIATIFVAAIYGIDLTFAALATVVVTATMASIGTAGTRGAGIIMLSMVFSQVGLPLEGIALLMSIDPILDMLRTATNVTGDSAVTLAVASRNGSLDKEVFNTPLKQQLDAEDIEEKGVKAASA